MGGCYCLGRRMLSSSGNGDDQSSDRYADYVDASVCGGCGMSEQIYSAIKKQGLRSGIRPKIYGILFGLTAVHLQEGQNWKYFQRK